MFRLTEQACTVKNVNYRKEIHGEEFKLGCDITVKFEAENDILDMFDAELKQHLFREMKPEDRDMIDQVSDEPIFRDPRFPSLKTRYQWDWQGAGYRVEIPYGVSHDRDLYLIHTDIDKFSFECKYGGRVDIEFRIKCNPSVVDAAHICGLLEMESIALTLHPPTAEERAQMELDEYDPAA